MTWTMVQIGITIGLIIVNLVLVVITRRCIRMFQRIWESQDRVSARQSETNDAQIELLVVQRQHQDELAAFRTRLTKQAELLTFNPDTRRN